MKNTVKLAFGLFLIVGMLATPGCKKRGSGNQPVGPNGSVINPSTGEYLNPNEIGGVLTPGDIGSGITRISEGDVDILPISSDYLPVMFAYDSHAIAGAEQTKVEAIADYLRGDAIAGVIIEGHTDERGDSDYNQALGERRAIAVRDFLIALGIDGSRVQSRSFGEEMPADPGHNAGAWTTNRRAEFKLYHPRS